MGELASEDDQRWVCPNDRQLSLRAKWVNFVYNHAQKQFSKPWRNFISPLEKSTYVVLVYQLTLREHNRAANHLCVSGSLIIQTCFATNTCFFFSHLPWFCCAYCCFGLEMLSVVASHLPWAFVARRATAMQLRCVSAQRKSWKHFSRKLEPDGPSLWKICC